MRKNATPATRRIPSITPIAIPPLAPPDRPPEELESELGWEDEEDLEPEFEVLGAEALPLQRYWPLKTGLES
jgi:hypothetical protein